jgi:hypothetical protein
MMLRDSSCSDVIDLEPLVLGLSCWWEGLDLLHFTSEMIAQLCMLILLQMNV